MGVAANLSIENPMDSVEDLLPWKCTWKLVQVDLSSRVLVEASMEIHGIFHCRWKWKLPFVASINDRFYEYIPWKLP